MKLIIISLIVYVQRLQLRIVVFRFVIYKIQDLRNCTNHNIENYVRVKFTLTCVNLEIFFKFTLQGWRLPRRKRDNDTSCEFFSDKGLSCNVSAKRATRVTSIQLALHHSKTMQRYNCYCRMKETAVSVYGKCDAARK